MRKIKMPDGAEVVRTYLEYGRHIEAFFRRHYQLLIIVGRPGLSKSYQFEERIGSDSHLIRGWTRYCQMLCSEEFFKRRIPAGFRLGRNVLR